MSVVDDLLKLRDELQPEPTLWQRIGRERGLRLACHLLTNLAYSLTDAASYLGVSKSVLSSSFTDRPRLQPETNFCVYCGELIPWNGETKSIYARRMLCRASERTCLQDYATLCMTNATRKTYQDYGSFCQIIQAADINSSTTYRHWWLSTNPVDGLRNDGMPSYPPKAYPTEWKGWKEALGSEHRDRRHERPSDTKVRTWIYADERRVSVTIDALIAIEPTLSRADLLRVIRGDVKTAKGWHLDDVDPPVEGWRPARRTSDEKIRLYKGKQSVEGSRSSLQKKLGIKTDAMSRLLNGDRNTANGWSLSQTPPAARRKATWPRPPVSEATRLTMRLHKLGKPSGRKGKKNGPITPESRAKLEAIWASRRGKKRGPIHSVATRRVLAEHARVRSQTMKRDRKTGRWTKSGG